LFLTNENDDPKAAALCLECRKKTFPGDDAMTGLHKKRNRSPGRGLECRLPAGAEVSEGRFTGQPLVVERSAHGEVIQHLPGGARPCLQAQAPSVSIACCRSASIATAKAPRRAERA
jgi:hypothetical protein